MTGGTIAWSYKYDSDGLRTERSDGTKTYEYVYSGNSLVHMSVDSNLLYFTYDGSTPMTVTYNGEVYYYVTNLQGDVVAILDGSGNPVVQYTYDAWGKLLSVTGSMANSLGEINPLRYRGYIYDAETGLYYLQSRYYDPELGRFINADAYASTGQGILGNNMFAYCNNNPVNGCDPCGNCFHRWDFWNDCEICGGEKLGDKIVKSIASIKESLQKTVETEIKSNANVLEMLVSVSKTNTYKSLHGMYQVVSGLGKMADGIMLVAVPVPSPLDDLSGLVLLGRGGLTIRNGLVKLMEVGIDEMAP